MKLRLRHNSIRLRLNRRDVARLAEYGSVEESVQFGMSPHERLVYALIASDETILMKTSLDAHRVTVWVPKSAASEWTTTDQVAIEAEQKIGGGRILQIFVEKDFACIEPRVGCDDADTFPNPKQCAAG